MKYRLTIDIDSDGALTTWDIIPGTPLGNVHDLFELCMEEVGPCPVTAFSILRDGKEVAASCLEGEEVSDATL